MFKTITTFVLSLLLVGSSVHAASYYNTNNSEQGMCDVNCDNKKHRSSSHECDKCLNEEIFIKLNFYNTTTKCGIQ